MGVGVEVSPCPKSLDPEQVSTFACAARTGSPNTAKETGKAIEAHKNEERRRRYQANSASEVEFLPDLLQLFDGRVPGGHLLLQSLLLNLEPVDLSLQLVMVNLEKAQCLGLGSHFLLHPL